MLIGSQRSSPSASATPDHDVEVASVACGRSRTATEGTPSSGSKPPSGSIVVRATAGQAVVGERLVDQLGVLAAGHGLVGLQRRRRPRRAGSCPRPGSRGEVSSVVSTRSRTSSQSSVPGQSSMVRPSASSSALEDVPDGARVDHAVGVDLVDEVVGVDEVGVEAPQALQRLGPGEEAADVAGAVLEGARAGPAGRRSPRGRRRPRASRTGPAFWTSRTAWPYSWTMPLASSPSLMPSEPTPMWMAWPSQKALSTVSESTGSTGIGVAPDVAEAEVVHEPVRPVDPVVGHGGLEAGPGAARRPRCRRPRPVGSTSVGARARCRRTRRPGARRRRPGPPARRPSRTLLASSTSAGSPPLA